MDLLYEHGRGRNCHSEYDGYTQRFGLVHLDLETGDRTRKDSFGWYRELLAAQRR